MIEPKIIMPFLSHHQNYGLISNQIFGGIERFKKLVYEHIPNVLPVEITKEQRKKRIGKSIFHFEYWQYQPDIIFVNDASKVFSSGLIDYNVPVVWVCHEPLERTIQNIEMMKRFNPFIDRGGHLYFVSQIQHEFFDNMSKRILGYPIKNIMGYVNPSCCLGTEQVYTGNREYDAVTIGRTIRSKDPFWLHRKLENTNLKSAVITGKINLLKNDKEHEYFNFNYKWVEPRYTFRGLSHEETLYEMSKGGVFVSTWASESWGITALEALSYGLPLLLITSSMNKHASQYIAGNENHFRHIKKGIKSENLLDIIKEMNTISLDDRMEIAKITQENHSLQNFKNMMNSIFRKAL
jgi:hypothetical protein